MATKSEPRGKPLTITAKHESPPRPQTQPDIDADCVRAVLAGNRERFNELIERYQNSVLAIVRNYVHDTHGAEDIAQEIFVTAFSNLKQLRHAPLFLPWLMQIARHHSSESARRGKRWSQRLPLAGLEAQPEAGEPVHDRVSKVLLKVEELPEPYRQTVLLKYTGGLDCREIARREGVAIGTITSRLTRALAMLRTACEESP